jgi:hypothetical protein
MTQAPLRPDEESSTALRPSPEALLLPHVPPRLPSVGVDLTVLQVHDAIDILIYQGIM